LLVVAALAEMWSCNCNFNFNFNGEVIEKLGDIVYKMFVLLAALVTLKLTKITDALFSNPYTPEVVASVMVFFLLWISSIFVPNRITVSTFFPISFIYGIACAVSFAALTIISPNISIFNLVLWIIVFVVILLINYLNRNLSVASSCSEIELVSQKKLVLNGSRHVEGSVTVLEMGQSSTQQEVDEGVGVSSPYMPPNFDRDGDSMVDLEENLNRVVMMKETDAR